MKYAGGLVEGYELMQKLVNLDGVVKIIKIESEGFNEMEGSCYLVRIKATAPEGKVWQENRRKSLLFEFSTNSTWLEDYYNDGDDNRSEEQVIKDIVDGIF